ncbi:MAG TPA: hypothetical protein DCY48_03785 [Candidatus Magasanikbacteria bacterium]|nr:MAG: hypothetical protein A3I74_04490 [Candidatus Magasanikbacteria bacterium RIFCSPLOWO2_02_FULL_47_16]OGH79467.1 MAG: hypothetical protein A3C10_01460 [Candidatus Magasanikbacteria bacterium RIFCSPHIGHO2_02_FULL_48_18]OGH83365.1 MAG: hypothetical protein A3G08_04810 [Candidatus Magasanikbacteria bacterium RIFCSPLOWO2_12_FULL_47_9b]HAZ28866.1 hypothetical protein [Candidatus Magasanikbacteria bacterium]
MLDLRQRIFIAIGLTAGFIAAVVLLYIWVFQSPENEGNGPDSVSNAGPAAPLSQSPASSGPSAPQTGPVPQNPGQPVEAGNKDAYLVKNVARVFVERFASYSNQNNNSHIDDVLILATPKMGEWIQTQALTQANAYEGMTTVVISLVIETLEDDTAEVGVEAQQMKESSENEETTYRSGTVTLAKEVGQWKVSGFFWD